MSKDINLNQFKSLGATGAKNIKKYSGFLFFLAVLFIYTALVFRISILARSEPSEDQVDQANTTKRLKIDQNAVNKIQQLQDQNIAVQSLFEEARDNPFQ